MGTLIRLVDSPGRCFARVDLESRDPLLISVAQRGVRIRRTRLGFLGKLMYEEESTSEVARVARAIVQLVPDVVPGDDVRTPVLSAFLRAALAARTLSGFEALLAAARWVEVGLVGDERDRLAIQTVVREVGSVIAQSHMGFSEACLPACQTAVKEIVWLATLEHIRQGPEEPNLVQSLGFGYSQIAFAVPEEYAAEHALAASLLLARDLSRAEEPWFKRWKERFAKCAERSASDAAEFLARLEALP
jgi:hypothetical protein